MCRPPPLPAGATTTRGSRKNLSLDDGGSGGRTFLPRKLSCCTLSGGSPLSMSGAASPRQLSFSGTSPFAPASRASSSSFTSSVAAGALPFGLGLEAAAADLGTFTARVAHEMQLESTLQTTVTQSLMCHLEHGAFLAEAPTLTLSAADGMAAAASSAGGGVADAKMDMAACLVSPDEPDEMPRIRLRPVGPPPAVALRQQLERAVTRLETAAEAAHCIGECLVDDDDDDDAASSNASLTLHSATSLASLACTATAAGYTGDNPDLALADLGLGSAQLPRLLLVTSVDDEQA